MYTIKIAISSIQSLHSDRIWEKGGTLLNVIYSKVSRALRLLAWFISSLSPGVATCILYVYTMKNTFQIDSFLYSPCHYMRAWIHILYATGCYECVALAERKSVLQGSVMGQNCRAMCTM